MDDLRRDLAISLLGETQLSIVDIASELGFAESSAFHRAFKNGRARVLANIAVVVIRSKELLQRRGSYSPSNLR